MIGHRMQLRGKPSPDLDPWILSVLTDCFTVLHSLSACKRISRKCITGVDFSGSSVCHIMHVVPEPLSRLRRVCGATSALISLCLPLAMTTDTADPPPGTTATSSSDSMSDEVADDWECPQCTFHVCFLPSIVEPVTNEGGWF